uniref:Uncharacterized protein n=1 Tax=Rhizophora mucronata TaxID=61149 RepID=A0A2P2N193_RHIMU
MKKLPHMSSTGLSYLVKIKELQFGNR